MADSEEKTRALEAAMDWKLRLQGRPAPAVQRAFAVWHAVPTHAAAWAQAERSWKLLSELPPVTSHAWPARGQKPVRWRRIGVGGSFALAACLLAAMLPGLMLHARADAFTGTGETRQLRLADGSEVTLAPRSAVSIDYSAQRREVALLKGEAFFTVKHNAAHPFIVKAGDVSVTDVGTAFDVHRTGTQLSVDVAAGEVAVQEGQAKPAFLGAGQTLALDTANGSWSLGQISPVEIAEWRDGYLYVKAARVSDAVAQISAYLPGKIMILDPSLATHTVTGLYDVRQPLQALRLMIQPTGGTVRQFSPYLTIISAY